MTLRSVYHSCNDCFIIHKLDSAVLFMLSSTLLNEHIQWDEMFIMKRVGIQNNDSQTGIFSYFMQGILEIENIYHVYGRR